jgi:hypothetical protein
MGKGILLLGLCIYSLAASASSYESYFQATLRSLTLLRTASGIPNDKIRVIPREGSNQVSTILADTSPTNLGLDLLVLLDSAQRNSDAKNGALIERALLTLQKLPFHEVSGLFFSWYQTKSLQPTSQQISAVDNLHLALALWTATQILTSSSKEVAARLLNRLDFSTFYDKTTGFVGGNLRPIKNEWVLDRWRYDHLGSEARSIYTIGSALGLFRQVNDADFPERALRTMTLERGAWRDQKGNVRPIFRLWHGGAFQLMLPDILASEHSYSPALDSVFRSYSDFIRERAGQGTAGIPQAFSACSFGIEGENTFPGLPEYNGNAGNPEWVSRMNVDFTDPKQAENWDKVITPHAIFLAARFAPAAFLTAFQAMEYLGNPQEPLYLPEMGWMDGYIVRGVHKNRAIPVQLSLDQTMIALSLSEILNPDHQTVSSRALARDPQIHAHLTRLYRVFDERWEHTLALP